MKNVQQTAGIKTSLWMWVTTGLFLAILIVVGVLVSRPTNPKSQPSTVILRLGYRPQALADITPVIIKEANLNRPNLEIDLVAVSSPTDGFTKFQNGEVDALAGMPLETVFKQLIPGTTRRTFTAYALQVDKAGEGWVSLVGSKQQGITQIMDLADKTVGSLATDQAEYLLRRILVAAGIPSEHVRIARYNPATPLTGLRSGEFAGMFGLEPAITTAVNEGNIVLSRGPVSHYLFHDQPIPVSASLIADDFIKAHLGSSEEFNALIDEALALAKSDPNRVRTFFQKSGNGGLIPSVADHISLPVMVKPSQELKTVTQQFLNDLIHDGIQKDPVDLSPLFPLLTAKP